MTNCDQRTPGDREERAPGPIRVLHLEEEPGDRGLLEAAFEACGLGHAIETVHSGPETGEALRSGAFDVVLAAAGGRGRDPFELLRTVRDRAVDLPVVFLSASKSQELALQLMDAGASGFVSKDRLIELVPAVCRAMREASADRARRAREAALAASEQRYRSIIEESTEWIWEIDAEARHVFNNRAVERVLGRTPEELQGRSSFDQMHEEDAAIGRRVVAEAISAKTGWTGAVVRWRHRDGTYRYLESNAVPLLGPDGELIGFRGTDRDAGARLRLEEELRNAHKMDAVGRLAGGVAHDFNNLLTSITGYGYLLRESLLEGDERRELVREIDKAAQRAAALTQQLLAFGRQQITQSVALDVGRAVRDLERLLRDLVGERIELVLQLGSDLHAIRMDPSQFEQVVVELVVNARDAMPESGKVFVKVRNEDPRDGGAAARDGEPSVRLSVEDTGSGMDSETLARVFEPFFTTRGRASGRGLGLSTVFGIVKHAGGHIAAFSAPGEGTRFDVFLPSISEVPAPPARALDASERPSPGARTVLLVEDEAPVRTLLRKSLEREGYEVFEAGSAEEARGLAQGRAGTIDLLVTDSVLPGMSGPALARELAAARPAMKVLFVSGYTDDEALRGGRLAAGQAFLQKPFSLEVLSARLRELVGRQIAVSA